MVQRRVVVLTDDVDGGEADETVGFELDGTAYEIDLSKKHVQQLRDSVATWVGHARRTTPMPTRLEPMEPVEPPKLYDPKAVRAFARARGLKVSGRGRPSQDVLDQYFAAGN